MNVVFRRLTAFFIDCMVLAAYASVLFGGSPFLRPLFTGSPYSAELTGFLLLTLPFVLYVTICEASKWQATIGKRIMKLRVVNADTGRRLHVAQAALRSALKFLPWELAHFAIWHTFIFASSLQYVAMGVLAVSYLMMFTYIVGLLRRNHQPIYDRFARTKVVY